MSEQKIESHRPCWWEAVLAIAPVAIYEGWTYQKEGFYCDILTKMSFGKDSIDKAFQWFQMVANSGQLTESLSLILAPRENLMRLGHPLERVFMSEKLWRQFEDFRRKGIFSPEKAEILIEGMRALDTRDWEDEEVRALIAGVMSTSFGSANSENTFKMLARGRIPVTHS